MPNALFLTDYFWPHVGGGVEVVVEQLSGRLVSRGHSVTVNTKSASAARVATQSRYSAGART